jgi:hypothetical protein
MKKLTGWKAIYAMKKYQYTKNNEELLVPKRTLVKHGVWDEVVEMTLSSGCSDDEIRDCFEEYGCSEEEIDGYFAQYEQPLAMGASAGA